MQYVSERKSTMNTELDAKSIERNVWQDSLRDGLMELFLGAYLLLTGIFLQAEMTAMFIFLMVFAPVLLKRAKERITYPRIGYVKFTEAGKKTGRRILVALAGALLVILLVVFFARDDDRISTLYQWVPLLPALLFLAVLIPIGSRSGLIRYYVMAGLALAVGLAIPFMGLAEKLDSIALYLGIMGSIFLVWGVPLFTKFLRAYPVRSTEAQ
jgi:hypothetical protein